MRERLIPAKVNGTSLCGVQQCGGMGGMEGASGTGRTGAGRGRSRVAAQKLRRAARGG